LFARTDAAHGVWKALAGSDAALRGFSEPDVPLADADRDRLNALGVTCLRDAPGIGPLVCGARTLATSDAVPAEWKYVPVRRLALHIEESVHRGTQWAVFEPNDEALWNAVRLAVAAFLNDLFRRGAFQGSTPEKAYFVACGADTMTREDIDAGILNIVVGFAPLAPAEFVILRIRRTAGASPT
jgi:Bacteriophage tail sheath protein